MGQLGSGSGSEEEGTKEEEEGTTAEEDEEEEEEKGSTNSPSSGGRGVAVVSLPLPEPPEAEDFRLMEGTMISLPRPQRRRGSRNEIRGECISVTVAVVVVVLDGAFPPPSTTSCCPLRLRSPAAGRALVADDPPIFTIPPPLSSLSPTFALSRLLSDVLLSLSRSIYLR